jgi:hypothetical protein
MFPQAYPTRKAVAAQMHPAIPAGDHDDMVNQSHALHYLQDHRAGPRLAAIALQGSPIGQHDRPTVVLRRLCELTSAAERGKEVSTPARSRTGPTEAA